jgi:hypothetical protein
MNFFFLFLFFPFSSCTFGSKYVLTLDNFIHFCRELIDLYFMYLKDESFENPLIAEHDKLSSFLCQYYKEDPIELFNSVMRNRDLQVTCLIIGLLNISMKKYLSLEFEICSTELYPMINSPTFYFGVAKELMFNVSNKRWTSHKEILPILCSIQRHYLPNLDGDERQVAEGWIAEYEFLYHSFDPSDLNAFLKLFQDLWKTAILFVGPISYHRSSLEIPILKLLNRFRLYCNHFYNSDWEKFNEVEKFPLQLLFVFITGFSDNFIFIFLKDPKTVGPSLFYHSLNKDFSWIQKIYETKFKCQINSKIDIFKPSHELSKFLHPFIKTDDKPCKLKEREKWLIRVLLHIISQYKVRGQLNFY